MTLYQGARIDGVCSVRADGHPLSPRWSLSIRNHSPDGFNWGYGGSGPAQLALALLLEETTVQEAQRMYQLFKWTVIAKLNADTWAFTSQGVRAWIEAAREGKRIRGPFPLPEAADQPSQAVESYELPPVPFDWSKAGSDEGGNDPDLLRYLVQSGEASAAQLTKEQTAALLVLDGIQAAATLFGGPGPQLVQAVEAILSTISESIPAQGSEGGSRD